MNTKITMLQLLFNQMEQTAKEPKLQEIIKRGKDVISELMKKDDKKLVSATSLNEKANNQVNEKTEEKKIKEESDNDSINTEDVEEEEYEGSGSASEEEEQTPKKSDQIVEEN